MLILKFIKTVVNNTMYVQWTVEHFLHVRYFVIGL